MGLPKNVRKILVCLWTAFHFELKKKGAPENREKKYVYHYNKNLSSLINYIIYFY